MRCVLLLFAAISLGACKGDRLRYYLAGSTPAEPGYHLSGNESLRRNGDVFVLIGYDKPIAAFTRRWNP